MGVTLIGAQLPSAIGRRRSFLVKAPFIRRSIDDPPTSKVRNHGSARQCSALKRHACKSFASRMQTTSYLRLGPRYQLGYRHEQCRPKLAYEGVERTWRPLQQLVQHAESRQALQQDGRTHLLPGLGLPLQMIRLRSRLDEPKRQFIASNSLHGQRGRARKKGAKV